MSETGKLRRGDGDVDPRELALERRLLRLVSAGVDWRIALDEIAGPEADVPRGWPGRVTRTLGLEHRPLAASLPEVRRDLENDDDHAIDPTAELRVSDALRGAGQGLPHALRAALEGALATDLGAVRVHDDAAAHEAARALNARAFTIGQDIFFREGAFDPDSERGRRLVAHEVAHTQQPGGAITETLQVSQPGDASEREAETFADRFVAQLGDTFAGALGRNDDARRVERLATSRAPGTIHLDRTPGPRERATRLRIALGVGDTATFTLESDGGAPFTATGTASGLTPGDYTVRTPPGATQMQIAAADTSGPRRTLTFNISIPATERGMHTLLRRAHTAIPMVVSGTALDRLPPRVREVFGAATGARPVDPADEPTIARIGEKLAQLSPSELEAFRARTIGVTSDLAAFEAGVDRYLAEVRQQQQADAEVERTSSRLQNLDALYARYRLYRQMQTTATISAAPVPGAPGGVSLGMTPTLNRMRQELTTELARFGFASIEAFQAALDEYLAAVRTAAVLVGREQLDRYEHRLVEEQTRYQDPASAQSLHAALAGARGHFQRANQIRDAHASTVVMTPGEMQEQAAASAEFRAEQGRGRQAMADQRASHPLLANSDLPHEEMALASESDCRNIMLRYIAGRRSDVQQTRTNLGSTPNLVFELPDLMRTAKQRLAITPGSFLDRVIEDRNRDASIDRAMINLAVGVIALAAGLVSGGTGTVAVLGAATAVGIGAYQAVEEYRRYETMSAAHGAQLTAEDPSMAWVIVAVVGVALDGAAMVRAVSALRPTVQAFNQGRQELAALETAIRDTRDLPPGVAEAVIRAARQEAEARAAWRAVLRPPAVLRAVVVPGAEEFGRLAYAVYLSTRRGVTRFRIWVRTSEAVELVGDAARLAPEDLTLLRNGYRQAIADGDAIARHGVSLRMSDEEIAAAMQRWSRRPNMTANDVMAEMSTSRGAPRPGAAAAESGATQAPWAPPRGWNGPSNHGRWMGARGNSAWIDDREDVIRIVGRNPHTGEANAITFRNGEVDFTPWSRGQLDVPGLTGEHTHDMNLIRDAIADRFNLRPGASPSARRQAALDWLRDADDGFSGRGLAPHHAGGNRVQLIPKGVHRVQHTDMHDYTGGAH